VAAIAPRRAGFVVFSARIISIFTGLLFITMTTHALTTSQFGLLEVVADLIAFSAYPLTVVNFWSARDMARGEPVGRTAFLSALILLVLGSAIFVLFAILRQSPITMSLALFLISLSLVPASFFYQESNSLLSVYNPQATGYVLLFGELSKLAIAFPLLVVFRVGISGALTALAGSNVVLGASGMYFVRDTLSGSISVGRLKSWLRDAWLPALNQAPNLIGIADTFVAFLISGPILVGYYQAAFSVALIVGYSGSLSYALYPLLLKGAGDKTIGVLFDFMMLFGIPMAIGAAVLSPQLLFLLSKRYVSMAIPLAILAFSALAGAVGTLVDRSLMGKESSDLAVEDRFKKLLKSNIFFDAVANLGYSTLYVASVALIVALGAGASMSVQVLSEYWALSQLILTFVFLLVKVRRLGFGVFRGTLTPLGLYVACALVMGAVVYILAPLLLSTSLPTVYYGLRLASVVGFGAVVYFAVLTAVDVRSRERFARMWSAFSP
jgi:O-antigen/teichoic acid export membrane protein